jgi:DNA-binding transcriptional ArsR family regulator
VTIWSHKVAAVEETERDDLVFKALADPTRRALLDELFALDGQTVQALCERHPEMTRFGVMKHLAVLESANLVVAIKEGRSKRHFLNPIPIQQLSDRWIDKYARPFTRAMTDLQRQLERTIEQQQREDIS